MSDTAAPTAAVSTPGTSAPEASASAHDEQELYQRLNKKMRHGLKQIYKEISTASMDPQGAASQTDQLFHEASAQLSEVLATTQAATESIMDIVETHLDFQTEATEIITAAQQGSATPEQLERLAKITHNLGDDLTTIMTTLSFQDLTGQRIKKVVEALNKIENTVVELYISSGLILKGREDNPQKDIRQLEEEAQQAAQHVKDSRESRLKGPVQGVSQANIDELMAQLGMD